MQNAGPSSAQADPSFIDPRRQQIDYGKERNGEEIT
jgi:hypothetical protein